MNEPLRILCVCSHNRTRSVIAAAMLDVRLNELEIDAHVTSAGFASDGEPATGESVRLLAERGIDVSAHRSRRIDADIAASSDLILTAQHDHVVDIAGRSPALFDRTFTLPEIVERAEPAGARGGRTLDVWLGSIGAERPSAFDYLDAGDSGAIGEVADPTGRSPRDWAVAMSTIDELTRRLAELLS